MLPRYYYYSCYYAIDGITMQVVPTPAHLLSLTLVVLLWFCDRWCDCIAAMVPRQLSENLCSLRGGVDRRTFSVLLQLDQTGQPKHGSKPWFGQSIVRSRGKISYEVAQDVLEARRADPVCSDVAIGDLCQPELQDKEDAAEVACEICDLQRLASQMRVLRLRSTAAACVMTATRW